MSPKSLRYGVLPEVAIATIVLLLCAWLALGCSAAEQAAARDTLKPIVKVTCAVARRVVQACPLAESAVGAEDTSGGEDDAP